MPERTDDRFLSAEKALTGLLALVVAQREDELGEDVPRRTEVLLADAGLSIGEIATVTGKKYDTVKTALRRARK